MCSFIQRSIYSFIHLDLEVGQRVEEGGVSHGDLVGHILERVDGAAVHGRRRRQVRGNSEEISWRSRGGDKQGRTETSKVRGSY